MRPGHDDRITNLFRRGNSMDLICELGALYGWTRADAKAVLAEHGWALTWNGRLQPQFMRGNVAPVGPSIADADPERLLNAGVDHEVTDIRKAAIAVERALEKLRLALLAQERIDADAAARRQAAEALQDAFDGRFAPRSPAERERVS